MAKFGLGSPKGVQGKEEALSQMMKWGHGEGAKP
jgi:hypothetical protein